MTTAVLLPYSKGSKEFVREAHIHGFRDGMLLLAAGAPGAGLDAEIIRSVAVADLNFAETCEQDDMAEDGATDHSAWFMSWPEG